MLNNKIIIFIDFNVITLHDGFHVTQSDNEWM